MSAFLLCFIGFETMNFYIFFINISCFGSNLFFKKKRTNNNYEKRGHTFVEIVFLEILHKISSQRGTWQLIIFTYFASSSALKLSRHFSFNLARSTYSFYWCYIFILNIRDLKISIQNEKHISFYSYWLT